MITYILGAGRCGTTILTEILVGNGYYMPPKHKTSLFEDPRVERINNKILSAVSSDFYSIDFNITPMMLEHYEKHDMLELIDEYEGYDNPVIKDPRMLFLTDIWKTERMIGIFRYPTESVKSHYKWNNGRISNDKLITHWLNYNKRLLELYYTHGFPVLNFNSKTLLRDISAVLGFTVNPKRYDPQRVSECDEIDLYGEVKEIYNELLEIVI